MTAGGEARDRAALAAAALAAGIRLPEREQRRLLPLAQRLRSRGEIEGGDLISHVTNGETYFFRDRAQLDFVVGTCVPRLRAARGAGAQLRIWSAACSTGEEAYSLAILLRARGAEHGCRVVGSDISRQRIEHARRGRYRPWSLRVLTPTQVQAYFQPEQGEFTLRPEIRSAVRFEVLNLLNQPAVRSLGRQDVILCRNALMYLRPDAVRKAAAALLGALSPDGVLLLGASDPPLRELVDCHVETTDAGLVYRRAKPRPLPAAPAPPPAPARPAAPPSAAPPDGRDAARRVRALADRGAAQAALQAAERAAAAHPEDAELAYLQALLHAEAGAPGDALALARQVTYLDPDLAVGHLLTGQIWIQMGKPAEAARALQRAVELLADLPAGAEVPASGGELAARLLATARALISTLER